MGETNMNEQEIINLINQANNTAFDKIKDNKLIDAEIILAQTIKISQNEKSFILMGLLKHKQGKFEESIEYFQKSLELNSNDPETNNNLAVCYSNLGNYEKAIEYIEKAIAIEPNSHLLYNNLALQHRHMQNFEKAIANLKKAIEIKDNEVSWGMLGGCYGETKQLAEAEKCFEKALVINPNFAAAHVDLACIYHLNGEWEKAWPEYEWRYEVYDQLKIWKKLFSSSKLWKGQSLENKKIIVHGEQGHGDSIHFFRYISLLKRKNPYIILYCNPILQPIFEKQVNEVYTIDPLSCKELPDHDYHCSIVSLPYLLQCQEIPNEKYIFIDEQVNFDKNFFNIGVVWAGNPQHPNDRNRSCPLKLFKEIEKLPYVKLFSLMKDIRPRAYRFENKSIDLTEGCKGMKIIDLSETMNNFYDTAKIINGLDLIITVDTALLHLAGAMGKQTLALIPYNNDWRWGLQGNKTIWYPSVELFRQNKKGEWKDVFDNIKKRVEEISSTLYHPLDVLSGQ